MTPSPLITYRLTEAAGATDADRCGNPSVSRSVAPLERDSIFPEPADDLVEVGRCDSAGSDGADAPGVEGGEIPSRACQPVADGRHVSPGAPSDPDPTLPAAGVRLDDLSEGTRRVALVLQARQLRAAGRGWQEVARLLETPMASIFKWVQRVEDKDCPTAQDLAPKRGGGGRPRHAATEQDKAALRGHYLITNRTWDSGSSNEAARMALRRGELSPALAQQIRDRDAAGQRLLPESLRDQVIVNPAVVRAFRNRTEANLDFVSCPGSLKFVKDRATGEKRFARAGDIIEMDDATINFPVCVPWDRAGLPGHPCADRYGVIVGRFQWLVCIDAGEEYVPGWSYTARPRSSYRGEDILATLLGVFRQHGVWERARFERGVFESHLVKSALERLNVELHTVHSPHTKAFIEGLFSAMWTKLSDMPGQVGRFRGEMEDESKLVEACRTGARDPRKHFPLLADALGAFRRAVAEKNAQWITSSNYGKWIPEQRWQLRRGEGRLRPLDPGSEWIFSPCVREETVRGIGVGCTVRYAEGISIRYDFQSDFLCDFDGEKVKLFFDPFSPQCDAVVVLVNSTRTVNGGTVLGRATQTNQVARYARRMFGYGDEEDDGIEIARRAAQALRRQVTTILPGGKPGVQMVEARDGLDRVERAETIPSGHGRPETPSARRGIARVASEAEFKKQSDRLSRMAAAQAALDGSNETTES